MRILLMILLPFVLSACTVTYEADKVYLSDNKELCIIEKVNPRKEFIDALEKKLRAKSYAIERLPPGTKSSHCNAVLKYTTQWSWDFVDYLSSATIYIIEGEKVVAKAQYRAPSGGGAMTFSIYASTESKVEKLLDELIPLQEN